MNPIEQAALAWLPATELELRLCLAVGSLAGAPCSVNDLLAPTEPAKPRSVQRACCAALAAQWEAEAEARHRYAKKLRDDRNENSQLQSRYEHGWATALDQCAEELRRHNGRDQ